MRDAIADELCRLVIDAIKDLDPHRKCFRMVGTVIVERSVAEVLPAVQSNLEQVLGVCAFTPAGF